MTIFRLLSVCLILTLGLSYSFDSLIAAAEDRATARPKVSSNQQGFTISWSVAYSGPIPLQAKTIQPLRTLAGHTAGVAAVAFSPAVDGKASILASASLDNTIKLWRVSDGRVNDGQLIRTLRGHKDTVAAVAFSPEGKTLASASLDNTIKLWRVSDGQLIRTLKGHVHAVAAVAFSPAVNGKASTLASASWDNTIKLWRVSDGRLIRTLKGHTSPVFGIAFSPKGETLASASEDNTIKLWRVSDGQLIRTLTGHKGTVFSVTFAPAVMNGKASTLASASWDNTIKLWRVSDGQLIRTLKGHTSVVAIAFAPAVNGKASILASASLDNTIKLWRVNDGQLIRTLKGHAKNVVSSIAFSPAVNGKASILAAASLDNTIKLWGTAPLRNQDELLTALQQQNTVYLEQIKTSLGLTLIPEPDLPKPKLETKGSFESKVEFNQRISHIRDNRKKQIAGIQRKYQRQVKARNRRLERFQVQAGHYQNTAMAKAFRDIYGTPGLQAMRNDDGKPDYNAEQHQLHVELTFSKLSSKLFKRKLALAFSDNSTGEAVYKALAGGTGLPISARWDNQQGSVAFAGTKVIWKGQALAGSISHAEGFKQTPLAVNIGVQDEFNQLLQNPVLKDAPLERVLKQERKAFEEDDIPALLQNVKTATIDDSKWLFVIGAGQYKKTHNIIYSRRSAELFAKTAAKVLGINTKKRQYLLLDEDASSGNIEDSLINLVKNIRPGDSIYFYFSGHGIPSVKDGNRAYMLPVDRVPQYISNTAFFKLDNIYQLLLDSKADHIFAFMDSCFSGSADNNSVFGEVTGSSLVRPRSVEAQFGNRMTVLTAGTAGQYSTALEERGHRMFSYHLIKALLGSPATFAELATQVQQKVKRATQGAGDLEQTPDWLGSRSLNL